MYRKRSSVNDYLWFQALEKRYDALLTMYGEKQEEADELRLDLADVKTLYRAQVNFILK